MVSTVLTLTMLQKTWSDHAVGINGLIASMRKVAIDCEFGVDLSELKHLIMEIKREYRMDLDG